MVGIDIETHHSGGQLEVAPANNEQATPSAHLASGIDTSSAYEDAPAPAPTPAAVTTHHNHHHHQNHPGRVVDNVPNVSMIEPASTDDDHIVESVTEFVGHQHKHALHRFRRHKKKAPNRDLVISFLPKLRASIIDRKDLYHRFGKQEQEVLACFDFLDNLLVPTTESCSPLSQHEASSPTSSSSSSSTTSLSACRPRPTSTHTDHLFAAAAIAAALTNDCTSSPSNGTGNGRTTDAIDLGANHRRNDDEDGDDVDEPIEPTTKRRVSENRLDDAYCDHLHHDYQDDDHHLLAYNSNIGKRHCRDQSEEQLIDQRECETKTRTSNRRHSISSSATNNHFNHRYHHNSNQTSTSRSNQHIAGDRKGNDHDDDEHDNNYDYDKRLTTSSGSTQLDDESRSSSTEDNMHRGLHQSILSDLMYIDIRNYVCSTTVIDFETNLQPEVKSYPC